MNAIQTLVSEGGGLLHKRQLVAHGARDRQLTWAVRRGYVRRPRRGWYTTFSPSDPRYVAVRAGGRLTGASSLALLGAWLWSSHPPITVSVPSNASRFRRLRGVRVVWDSRELSTRGSTWSVAPRDALREALLELSFEEAVSLLDWALSTSLLDVDELSTFLSSMPRDITAIEDWVDPQCESFLESIVRTRGRQMGRTLVSQDPLWNGQRIDLVVDGVLGIETDGREFHAATFESDRRKDVEILISGKATLRLSYTMIRDDWLRVTRAIEAALSSHRRGPHMAAARPTEWPKTPRRGPRLWRLRSTRRKKLADRSAAPPSTGRRVRHGQHRRLGTIFG
jgi:very-short-patch-repair endonuclease